MVPLLIAASVRKNNEKSRIFNILLNVLTSIFHPINLNYKLVATKWMKKKILSLNDPFFAPDFEEQTIKIQKLEQEFGKIV